MDMYVDWVVKEHFESINVYLMENATGIQNNDAEAVCREIGGDSAFLLTADKNLEVVLK